MVATLPVHANHPEQSRGGLGGITKHGTNRNGYEDSVAYRLVQDTYDRRRHLVLSHSSHFLSSVARSF